MKLRALGTGSPFVKHPIETASFLLESEGSSIVFGCGFGIPKKLESINIPLSRISIWAPLNSRLEQIGGLQEIAFKSLSGALEKPYLAAPQGLLDEITIKLSHIDLSAAFNLRATKAINIQEDHHSDETIRFVPNYLQKQTESYGLVFDSCGVFISGESALNSEYLHRHGSPSEIILHSFSSIQHEAYTASATIAELETLPIYIQRKIWLYGYEKDYHDLDVPLPMLFLPQGQDIYDSSRKMKYLDKEKFILDEAKRVQGNTKT